MWWGNEFYACQCVKFTAGSVRAVAVLSPTMYVGALLRFVRKRVLRLHKSVLSYSLIRLLVSETRQQVGPFTRRNTLASFVFMCDNVQDSALKSAVGDKVASLPNHTFRLRPTPLLRSRMRWGVFAPRATDLTQSVTLGLVPAPTVALASAYRPVKSTLRGSTRSRTQAPTSWSKRFSQSKY